MKVMNIMTKEMWVVCFENVQQQCLKVGVGLICELKRRFLVQEFLNAIKVIYPQYWLALEMEITFISHLVILHAHFKFRGLLMFLVV